MPAGAAVFCFYKVLGLLFARLVFAAVFQRALAGKAAEALGKVGRRAETHLLADLSQTKVGAGQQGLAFGNAAVEQVVDGRGVVLPLESVGKVVFVYVGDLGQLVQPLVRHRHDAGVRFDGAEGIVCSLRVLGGGDGVEQSGLAHVGQADNT